MVTFRPFEPCHLDYIDPQRAQLAEFGALMRSPQHARELRYKGVALTALGDTPDPARFRVLACAGLVPQWRGRAILWGLVSEEARPEEWTAIVRRTRSAIASAHRAGIVRIEAVADARWRPACRLLEILGFERETARPMELYGPDGSPAHQYAHVRLYAEPAS